MELRMADGQYGRALRDYLGNSLLNSKKIQRYLETFIRYSVETTCTDSFKMVCKHLTSDFIFIAQLFLQFGSQSHLFSRDIPLGTYFVTEDYTAGYGSAP
ncbi:hypothetical protein CEXT_355901 [Caerostris extrusa]|uniref:Uncharacterized protein n=1 Tax=Caerostris extrusa TaxID=172846 RepID=A0AAV4MHC2_CAEEX|nr:hypothetical protein CEXT_355901 [Caerostris extrusa]